MGTSTWRSEQCGSKYPSHFYVADFSAQVGHDTLMVTKTCLDSFGGRG